MDTNSDNIRLAAAADSFAKEMMRKKRPRNPTGATSKNELKQMIVNKRVQRQQRSKNGRI